MLFSTYLCGSLSNSLYSHERPAQKNEESDHPSVKSAEDGFSQLWLRLDPQYQNQSTLTVKLSSGEDYTAIFYIITGEEVLKLTQTHTQHRTHCKAHTYPLTLKNIH